MVHVFLVMKDVFLSLKAPKGTGLKNNYLQQLHIELTLLPQVDIRIEDIIP